jgi:hypothetical protein
MTLTTHEDGSRSAAPRPIRPVPELEDFIHRVRSVVHADDVESFWRCLAAFDRLIRTDVLTTLLNLELERMAADPRYVPKGASADGQWLIGQVNGCALVARAVVAGPGGLADRALSPTEHAFIGHVTGAPLSCNVFSQPEPQPNDVFDPTRQLAPPRRITLRPGDSVPLVAGSDVVQVIPDAAEPTILLKLLSPPVVPLLWEYDLVTRAPIRAVSGSVASSRLEYMAALMASMDHAGAAPTLVRMAGDHPHHFVRWAALRAVAALDRQEGERLLQVAAADPHPHIRRAAVKALRTA